MNNQSGRSLIELLGVLAITGVMSAGAIALFSTMRNEQRRAFASATLEQIAQDTKLLMQSRGTYAGLSVDYLIKAGALSGANSPIGGADWRVAPYGIDDAAFAITLTDLSQGECQYFVTARAAWATAILVNGYETDMPQCLSSNTNQIVFVVE